jgi:K+-sensing histidine kinase KdpD
MDTLDKIIEQNESKKIFIIKKDATGIKFTTHQVLFERLLNNIIENAIKYSSTKKVTI